MEKAPPPTKMSKEGLKETLLAYGYREEELQDEFGKTLKRPKLIEKLKDHQRGEEGLAVLPKVKEEDDIGIEVEPKVIFSENVSDEVGESDDEDSGESIYEELTPDNPKWTQYVLSQFLDDEMDEKNPRVEGLRRVANKLVGEIIEEGCDLIAEPTQENGLRACAKAWGIFLKPNGHTVRFEALADAGPMNCLEGYATYLVAMADTRAKGRMYRNALYLRRVVSAEEVNKTMAMSSEVQKGGHIHTGQVTMIRMMIERNNVDINKILDELSIKYESNNEGEVNLQSLSYEDALNVSRKIREINEEKE